MTQWNEEEPEEAKDACLARRRRAEPTEEDEESLLDPAPIANSHSQLRTHFRHKTLLQNSTKK